MHYIISKLWHEVNPSCDQLQDVYLTSDEVVNTSPASTGFSPTK